ncbi:hypothetical protein [Deinococcus marmoris]|uniref:hypothetical protein n=1 Tax=Deinococcus marmoris TaxID=249408 RepID=UPI000497913C|nr:hypothetical protein [Deinococcus marmoris]
MTRVDLRPACPLTVQFWLLGLDARQGHLLLRGFQKRPASQGSSAYVLDTLTLHSSGLWVRRGGEVLHFNRRTHLYTLDDRLVPARFACQLLRSALQQHEVWIMERFGPAHRRSQFSAQRPPRPVARSLEVWRAYVRPSLDRALPPER